MALRKTAPLILSTTSFLLLGTVLGNAQTTSLWDGSIGLWNNAARWSTNPIVPNGDFIAGLNAGTATLSSPITLTGLNLNGGNVVADSSLTVNNGSLQSGSLTGGSTATFNGTVDFGAGNFVIGGSGMKTLAGSTTFGETDANPTLYLQGGTTLANTGSFLHRSGDGVSAFSSQIYFNTDFTGPAVLRNGAGGVFTADIAANASGGLGVFGANAGNAFQNEGGFVKTGAGEYTAGVAFANTGTVNVQAGRLTFNAGDGGSTTGDLTAAAGTVTALGSGTFTFGSGASLDSQGTVLSGGNVNFNAGSSLSAASLEVTGGALNIAAGAAFQSSGAVLSGGMLTGTGTPTLGGTTDFGAGNFVVGGSGVKTLAGSAVFGESDANPTLYLQGGTTLANTGSFLHRSGDGVSAFSSQIYFNTDFTGPAVLRNGAGGVFTADIAANASGGLGVFGANAGNAFQNEGGFVKTGAGEYTAGVAFANTGTVNVQAGRLTFNAGDGGSTTGDLTAAAGTVTALGSGTFTFGSGASIDSQGTVLSGGNVNFNAGSSLSAAALNVTGGTLNVSTGAAFQSSGAVLSGGMLTGTGTPTLGGTTDFGTGNFVIGGSGVKTLAGSAVFGESDANPTLYLQGGATLANTGSFLHRSGDGVSAFSSQIYFNTDFTGPAVLRNAVGGAFTADIAAGASGGLGVFGANPGNVFQNEGGFVKTGAGEYTAGVAFANTGTVNVQAGRLTFNSGDGGSTTGDLTAAAGTVTALAGGTFTFGSGASLDSQGTVLSGGNVNFNAGSSLSAASLEVTGGALNIAAGAAFQSANAMLSGGMLTGTGTPVFNGTVNFGTGNFVIGGSGVKTLAGSTTFGETDANPTLYLQGGATLANTGSFLHRSGDGVSTASGQIYFNTDFTGPAVLRNGAGGVFTADIAANASGGVGVFGVNAGNAFQNEGGFVKAGAGEYSVAVPFTNTGTVEVQAGRLTLSGNNFTNEGVIQVSGGAVLAATTTFTQSVNGLIAGTGTIQSPSMTLSGTVSPGFSPGTLTLAGDVDLTSVAVLQFELGPLAGPNDFISITGSLVLDGRLNIAALPGMQTGVYNLITASGGVTDQGLEFGDTPDGFSGTIGILGNTVQLQVLTLPVPEAASSLLVLLAAAGLTAVRRRAAAA